MEKAEKVVRKIASQVHCVGECSNTTNLHEVFRLMSCRLHLEMIVLKRRHVESDGSISWKRNVQSSSESRLGVCWSVLRILNQMISFDAWIFRKRKGFCWLHAWLKQDKFGKNRFSIDSCSSYCWVWSEKQRQSISATNRDRRQENRAIFFWANVICLNMFTDQVPFLVSSERKRNLEG